MKRNLWLASSDSLAYLIDDLDLYTQYTNINWLNWALFLELRYVTRNMSINIWRFLIYLISLHFAFKMSRIQYTPSAKKKKKKDSAFS